MQWKIMVSAGGMVGVVVLGLLWHESGNVTKAANSPLVAAAPEETVPVKKDTAVGKAVPQLSAPAERAGKTGQAGVVMPPPTEEERTYDRMVATEKRERIMHARMAYLEARAVWRRQLDAAISAAKKSGDDSEVKRLEAQAPDKKMYMEGGY